jgi:hypothetical protein
MSYTERGRGAVGVTTSIMSSGIPAYAQGHKSCGTFCESGRSTITIGVGTDTITFNGNLKQQAVVVGLYALCLASVPQN